MVVMKLKLDNIYSFNDFELDMSYPKKVLRSVLGEETLKGFPNFRYKKVNIVMGSNASGKTTLGKSIMSIFNFIKTKELDKLKNMVGDPSRPSTIFIDFIVDGEKMNRMIVDLIPSEDKAQNYKFSLNTEKILSRDSYQSCAARIESKGRNFSDYKEALDSLDNFGWFFSYPESKPSNYEKGMDKQLLKCLDAILRTLDPSIDKVEILKGINNPGFIIKKNGRDVVLQNGRLTDPNIFSSGTKEGIAISEFLAAMMEGDYGFFYCDEKFSYIHSSIESRLFGIMLSYLKDNEQLFFTTHNETMMELNLPKHSYTMLAREKNSNGKWKIVSLYANDYVQKASDNLRSAVNNNVIKVIPDDSSLDLLEKE